MNIADIKHPSQIPNNPWRHVNPEEILDWYFPEENPANGRVVIGQEFVEISAMDHINDFMDLLKTEIAKHDYEKDFNLSLKMDGGKRKIAFRAHRQTSIEGDYLILRRLPVSIPNIDNLLLPSHIKTILLHHNLNKGGLVIICGEPGNGKSTTTAACIQSRLQKFGGFCLTLENPIEMPLHGRHGKGFCFQSQVPEGGFEEALSAAMRCYPTATHSILYIGEIRSAETAAEALKISNSGHLVITTLHSSSTTESLKRILSLAKDMGIEESQNLLASSLRLAIHQKLEVPDKLKPNERKLNINFLFSPKPSSPVANRIRGGNIDGLVTEIEQQQKIANTQVGVLLKEW